MRLHHGERGVALLVPLADEMALLVELGFAAHRRARSARPRYRARGCTARRTSIAAPAARSHLSSGTSFGALGEVPQDRAGFGKEAPVVELEHRHAAVGVLREIVRACASCRHAGRNPCSASGTLELARRKPHLVAIAGDVHLMKREHACGLFQIRAQHARFNARSLMRVALGPLARGRVRRCAR